jgi:hypothetical protein
MVQFSEQRYCGTRQDGNGNEDGSYYLVYVRLEE